MAGFLCGQHSWWPHLSSWCPFSLVPLLPCLRSSWSPGLSLLCCPVSLLLSSLPSCRDLSGLSPVTPEPCLSLAMAGDIFLAIAGSQHSWWSGACVLPLHLSLPWWDSKLPKCPGGCGASPWREREPLWCHLPGLRGVRDCSSTVRLGGHCEPRSLSGELLEECAGWWCPLAGLRQGHLSSSCAEGHVPFNESRHDLCLLGHMAHSSHLRVSLLA